MIAQRKTFEQQAKPDAFNRMNTEPMGSFEYLALCSHCKEVKNEYGFWQPLEVFMEQESSARFVFGVCPDCHCSRPGE